MEKHTGFEIDHPHYPVISVTGEDRANQHYEEKLVIALHTSIRQSLTNGWSTKELEKRIGRFSNQDVILTNSGTQALEFAVQASLRDQLNHNIRKVILPAHTFWATYEAVINAAGS